MRNYFKVFSLLIMVLALSACGSGATSGDPLGTDSISNLAASPTSVGAGESSVITAKVIHADGKAAIGRTVSFSLATNNSVGTITVTDDGKNSGIATAIYTAGNGSPASSVQDTIQASISNGASNAVVIVRAAVPGGGVVGGQIALFSASKQTVSAGQSSILTANVTDGAGAPLSGVTVAFSIPTKNSGLPTLSVASAVTDGKGNAVTIYSPGTAAPTTSVDDVVQASLTNSATLATTITRSGNAAALANVVSTISASQTTLSTGQNSIITATVSDTAGNPVSGQTVTFILPIKGSGTPTLSAATATTDGRGNAITIYSPGTASATTSVEDMVQATITSGSTRTVSITRSGTSVAPTIIAMLSTLSASQTTLTAGQNSIITANVTDSAGNPVSSQTVTFSMVKSGSGTPTLSALTATTDGRGNAITIYSPDTASATISVEDIVQASLTNGSTRAVSITRSGTAVASSTAALISTLTASTTTLTAGQNSIISATVTDSTGNPISGQTVSFTVTIKGSGAPTLSTASASTDARGIAITIYTPGVTSPTSNVDDMVQASLTNGSSRAVSITRSGGNVTTTYMLPLAISKTTVTASQSSIVTATVNNSAGKPVSGETVNFLISIKGSGAPTLSAASVVTDTNGNAVTIYTPGVGSPTATVEDAIQATLTNGSGQAIIVTRSGNVSPATNYVTLAFLGPAASTDSVGAINRSGVITATVTNVSGQPVSGVTVTFSIEVFGTGVGLPPGGATLNNASPYASVTGVTDGNGKAVAIYTAGGTAGMTDVIKAAIVNGDAAIVIADY